ncbi:MAG: tRNA dihydrouridine synthase DusB [Clostridiales bacterium]|jgi:tRNA-dihydrouridine synthase B|nr:tRNA dihydrouridine synthase DusB [Clostridiales bacterium]
MKIGSISLDAPVIFAPMAGISDLVYRRICRSFGAGMVTTEMVSAKAIVHENANTSLLLRTDAADFPCVVQIFGSDPDSMGRAAAFLDDSQFVAIDINMGCPAPKIVKNGDGAALMREPALIAKIIRAVKANTSKPVTCKIRLGWDFNSINCIEIAKIAEDCDVSAITVHGRVRSQMFTGTACWEGIKSVKNAVNVPVVGNGDIGEPVRAAQLMAESGVDALMIGRASYGDPWVFKRVVSFLQRGIVLPMPTPQEKIAMALEHSEAAIEHDGEKIALREMRKHIAWYIKGLRGAAEAKARVNNSKSFDEVRDILLRLEGDNAY